MKTLSENVKDIVKTVILDDEYKKLTDLSTTLNNELKKDEKYKELIKAVDDYKTNYFCSNKSYEKLNKGILFTAFIAAKKMDRRINYGLDYIQDEKKLNEVFKSGVFDTDAKIASKICAISEKFEVKTKRRKKEDERIPYTIAEIRRYVTLIQSGDLDRDLVRAQIKRGKKINR